MADDTPTVEAAIIDIWIAEAQSGITQAHLDALIAAVRAETLHEVKRRLLELADALDADAQYVLDDMLNPEAR